MRVEQRMRAARLCEMARRDPEAARKMGIVVTESLFEEHGGKSMRKRKVGAC